MANRVRVVAFAAVLLFLASAVLAQSSAGSGILEMKGTPNDYITGGRQYRIGPDNGSWAGSVIYRESDGVPLGVRIGFNANEGTDERLGLWWDLEFHVVDLPDTVFGPGTYKEAMRAAFTDPGHPGLSVTGDGRGCNTNTGEFVVSEFEYDCFPNSTTPALHLTRFKASFKQNCEGGAQFLAGTIEYTAEPTGTSCTGGSDGGDGDGETPPPPPPPFQVTLPPDLSVDTLKIGNGEKKTIEFGTAVDSTFDSDLQLSVFTNAGPADDFHVEITPSHITAPGAGEGEIEVRTGPMTFPRTYTVTILATDDGVRFRGTSFRVEVQCTPPFILGTDQPKTIGAAGAAQLDLETKASGSGPFVYQWYRGFPGMTRTPVTTTGPKVTVPNDGSSYWVRVQNACGTFDSAAITASR
jgi:hypothetical protein